MHETLYTIGLLLKLGENVCKLKPPAMLEIFGTVIKEELVKTVDHHILPNSFVLENLEPYPGYHGENLPMDQGPDTFFLITNEMYSSEKIFRISHEIRSFTQYQFDGSPARICFGNDIYSAIRIRDLNSYDHLEEIQKFFLDAGIHFMKYKQIEGKALIELKKIFTLEQINEQVYKDSEGDMYYLQLNKQLTWGKFRSLTRWVKNNLSDSKFDAALAVLYGQDVHDMIRIYDQHPSEERLASIHKKYLEGMKRFDH